MKFNIDDYKGKYVMHCKTKEEAEDFCRYLDSIGRTWRDGDSYLSKSYWDRYKESMCYSFNYDVYCDKQYFEKEGYNILEMEDFMSDTMSNKDRINKVFEILGVKPNKYFKMIDAEFNKESNGSYCIDDNLRLHCSALCDEDVERDSSNAIIIDILRGKKVIIPIPIEEEQLAIDYALACGYSWIAKNKDGAIYAYKEKPQKSDNARMWGYDNSYRDGELKIELPISFLFWDDEEPYYIGD